MTMTPFKKFEESTTVWYYAIRKLESEYYFNRRQLYREYMNDVTYDNIYNDMYTEHNREYAKQYYLNNKDKVTEYQREYRDNNKEKIAERQRKYREANKEKIAEWKRQYRECNKAKINDYMKKYNNKYGKVILCGCGAIYGQYRKNEHEQTKKHQQWLTNE